MGGARAAVARARGAVSRAGLPAPVEFSGAGRRVAPRTVQSGATKRSGKTGKGNFYLKSGLGQAATGAAKTDTFLGERYWRLVKRMPKAKAKPRRTARPRLVGHPHPARSLTPASQPAPSRLTPPRPAEKPDSAPQRRQLHIPPQTPNRRSPAWLRCRAPTQDRYFRPALLFTGMLSCPARRP